MFVLVYPDRRIRQRKSSHLISRPRSIFGSPPSPRRSQLFLHFFSTFSQLFFNFFSTFSQSFLNLSQPFSTFSQFFSQFFSTFSQLFPTFSQLFSPPHADLYASHD